MRLLIQLNYSGTLQTFTMKFLLLTLCVAGVISNYLSSAQMYSDSDSDEDDGTNNVGYFKRAPMRFGKRAYETMPTLSEEEDVIVPLSLLKKAPMRFGKRAPMRFGKRFNDYLRMV